jgi:hypothetical protein
MCQIVKTGQSSPKTQEDASVIICLRLPIGQVSHMQPRQKALLILAPAIIGLLGIVYMAVYRPTAGLYIWPLFVIAAALVTLAIFAWQNRQVSGAAYFAAFTLGIAAWSLAYAFELGTRDLTAKLLWAKVEYPGIASVPWKLSGNLLVKYWSTRPV